MMKNKFFMLGLPAMVLVMGMLVVGCATASSIGGTADRHGLLSKANVVAEGSQELASYGVILGLLDSGYKEYADKVKQSEAQGKKITTVTKMYLGVYTKTTAYAQ